MPVQVSRGSLFAKLGGKVATAQAEHKGREPEVGGGRLPGGIENGIARLAELKIGEYVKEGDLKGQAFFSAMGVVEEPADVAGLQTRLQPEPLCDTPLRGGKRKTFSDHYGHMRDQLLILGFDIDELPAEPAQFEAALKEGFKDMLDPAAPIYFRFRTWKGDKLTIEQRVGGKFWLGKKGPYPTEDALKKANPYWNNDPLVNEIWLGRSGLKHYVPPGGTGTGMEDATNDVPAANGHVAAPAKSGKLETMPVVTNPAKAAKPVAKPVPVAAAAPDEPFRGDRDEEIADDLGQLLVLANAEDETARTRLQELAVAAGASPEEVEQAPDWEAVVALIQGDASEESPIDGEPADDFPEVGAAYAFHPLDPKTRKPTKRAVEAKVLSKDEGAQTCTLLNVADGKTRYLNILWTSLESAAQ